MRGGFVEFMNLDPRVYVDFKKMISAKLCSTVVGQVEYSYSTTNPWANREHWAIQAVMDCVVNPPKLGDPSYDLWIKVWLYHQDNVINTRC